MLVPFIFFLVNHERECILATRPRFGHVLLRINIVPAFVVMGDDLLFRLISVEHLICPQSDCVALFVVDEHW